MKISTSLGHGISIGKVSAAESALMMKKAGELPADIQALADARVQARKDRDWKKSDELRDQLKALGYIVEDTKEGQKVRKAV